MKLTETGIAKLKSTKADEIFFDDALPGFGVRLREGGSRKYVVHYRVRKTGIQRRQTLGSVGTLTLEEAKLRARKILVDVADGKDPAAEGEAKRAAEVLLFSAAKDGYLKMCERSRRPKTVIGYRGDLERLWKPLHGMALNAVTRPIIAAHLRQITENNGPISANRARGTLSALYAWAIGEGLCEHNPVIGTNTNDAKPRERVLSDAELVAIWKAAPDTSYGRIVKLLMLTGQRRDEIGRLRWSEIDLNGKQITLPGERTKNGKAHDVPLSDTAIEVLQGITRYRDLVFGTAGDGFGAWSQGKRPLDAACGVKDWTLHDLRRTAVTRMADLGVLPHVIEAVVNHYSGHKAGVAGVYNKSTYAKEKRAALDLWAGHVRVIVAQSTGANVTKLERKA